MDNRPHFHWLMFQLSSKVCFVSNASKSLLKGNSNFCASLTWSDFHIEVSTYIDISFLVGIQQQIKIVPCKVFDVFIRIYSYISCWLFRKGSALWLNYWCYGVFLFIHCRNDWVSLGICYPKETTFTIIADIHNRLTKKTHKTGVFVKTTQREKTNHSHSTKGYYYWEEETGLVKLVLILHTMTSENQFILFRTGYVLLFLSLQSLQSLWLF